MTLLGTLRPRERDILQLMTVDLSNAEIAERLVMTPGTVKWYIKEIYSKLDVHSRDEAIARAAVLNLAPQTQPDPSTPTNLPAPATSLVGRKCEIADVRQHLLREDVRLLTLVGTPGIGKTRLSLETAATLLSEFPDGVYFVPLAPLSDPALVANTIGGALGVQEIGGRSMTDQLKHYLRERSLLLVLDNFEHLLAGVSLVAELLAAASRLKVLATSREALRLYGEQEYPVPPLALPDPKVSGGIECLGGYEAVTLFVKRAQAVKPEFELTQDNALAVVAICARLDGLPLAIELAAARMKLYTPNALFGRLHKCLSALTGGARDLPERQQTLRGAIAWSYELLNTREQVMFARLGVFVGGWSLEAMEAVCGGASHDSPLQIDVYDALESLLNKSLVQQTTDKYGELRFLLLETIREYALEVLMESNEEQAIRRTHAEHFLALGARAKPEMKGEDHHKWLNILEEELDNLRAVLNWSREWDVEVGLRLAITLDDFWVTRGHILEGGEMLEQLLANSGIISTQEPLLWANALNIAARMAYVRGDDPLLRQRAGEALRSSQQLRDEDNILFALRNQGQSAALHGDYKTAERYCLEGLMLARQAGDYWFTCFFLNILGMLSRNQGECDRALSYHVEAARLIKQTDDGIYRLIILWETGTSFLFQGDDEQAHRCYMESLSISREPVNLAYGLEGFGGLAAIKKKPERAARLLAAAQSLRERAHTPRVPLDHYYDWFMAQVRAQLDEASFAAAWAEGAQMTLEQAVAYALSESG